MLTSHKWQRDGGGVLSATVYEVVVEVSTPRV
jgi:hypothetical protein